MGAGVLIATSVDPVSGEENAQGELQVAGARAALPFRAARGESLLTREPERAARVQATLRALDAEHGGPVRAWLELGADTETVTRVEPAELSPLALARVLVERVEDGRLTRAEAFERITPAQLESTGTFTLALETPPPPLARGLAASPGAAAGRLALPDDAGAEPPHVLVIDDASPEDAPAIRAAAAIVATSGGLTADAAIAARALRKPCVVSAPLALGATAATALGAWVTVDGSSGAIYPGALPTRWTASSPFAATLRTWLGPDPLEPPAAALLRARAALAQARPA